MRRIREVGCHKVLLNILSMTLGKAVGTRASLDASSLWHALSIQLEPSNLHDAFKRLLKSAELPNIRFHDLRHSAATILLGMGVHPKIVQELLGHSNISMTMDIYSHVFPSMQQDAMDKLDKMFRDKD